MDKAHCILCGIILPGEKVDRICECCVDDMEDQDAEEIDTLD